MSRNQTSKTRLPRDEDAAREKSLRLLSLRPRSAAELRSRLRSAGFEEDVIERVLSGFENVGIIDDEEFARLWIASREAAGGAGRRKLVWELRQKGVSPDLIDQVLDEELDEEAERGHALALARKRFRAEQPRAKEAARLRRFLFGRGFGFETVDSVLRTIMKDKET